MKEFKEFELKNISVIAGHFSWDVWNQLPSIKNNNIKNTNNDNNDNNFIPSCFVMGRHPVNRVISYYYQRCYREPKCTFYQVKFNDLSKEDLQSFITSFRQGLDFNGSYIIVDEGVEDAACRSLSNKKVTTGRRIGQEIDNGYEGYINVDLDLTHPLPLTNEEQSIALENVEKCVIGIQEDWENTIRILNYWFPWIKIGGGENEEENISQ